MKIPGKKMKKPMISLDIPESDKDQRMGVQSNNFDEDDDQDAAIIQNEKQNGKLVSNFILNYIWPRHIQIFIFQICYFQHLYKTLMSKKMKISMIQIIIQQLQNNQAWYKLL